ncbi:hypothetical protein RND81_09G139500 [Saponaria officinalis]|uniref:Secreted protein n=1 Tax=Saponaria officinalis TaxID=3572 RepID=A0AAW1IMF3_SAPOF
MVMGNSSVLPTLVRTLALASLYMSLMRSIYFRGTPFLAKTHQRTSLGTLSYAFSKSIKTICRSFFLIRWCSINCLMI